LTILSNHTALFTKQNKKDSKWLGPNVPHHFGLLHKMPTYDIYNKKTGETKEVFCTYSDKEKTLKEEGSDWHYQIAAPGLNYQGAITPIKRAGEHWNDVLKGVKKASGKDNTIEHY